MKNILIYIFFGVFISCCKTEPKIVAQIDYFGNQDRRRIIYISNFKNSLENNVLGKYGFQYVCQVDGRCTITKIKKYVQKNNTKRKLNNFNKLRIVFHENNNKTTYFFDAKDGIKFLIFLEKDVKIKEDKNDPTLNNEVFKNDILEPFKFYLKTNAGQECMYN
ncbi:hypothetical protein AAH994_00485 [Weeksellaceae bacterium A-14]